MATIHESALRVLLPRRHQFPLARAAIRAHLAVLHLLRLEGRQ